MSNTQAAIMATPSPLESIRLVGDEEKHATLLYFGETATLPEDAKSILVESVKMATGMLFPFSEGIQEISRLGSESPPALVAMLSDRNLTQVRNLFMMNPAVTGYLENTQQWPSFTPHVTLGHPDYVDEVIIRTLAKPLYRVRFDRLAVWWNDERIEFPLSQIVEGDVCEMSDAIGEFLEQFGEDNVEHSGVKGMKWGVRRRVDSSTGLVARTASADQIHADRIASKIKSGGTAAVSNRDLKDFASRIQAEQEFNRANASQEAQKGQNFVTKFLKTQGQRQFNRVADKAVDIAVEKALINVGIKVTAKGKHNIGDSLTEIATRIQPKQKKKGGNNSNP